MKFLIAETSLLPILISLASIFLMIRNINTRDSLICVNLGIMCGNQLNIGSLEAISKSDDGMLRALQRIRFVFLFYLKIHIP